MMSKLSLLDKLKVLSDVTSSSGLFVLAIVLLIILAYLLIVTNTRTKKTVRNSCIVIYGSITIILLLFYHKKLFGLFDYMMNNFFIALYFPNLAIYFAAIIATNIILLISVFNRNITKWIRSINTIIFCIINYLLILVMDVVTKNNLDIFKQSSIYQNKDAQALIELSSTIFIIWILFLVTYKLIRIYQKRQETSNYSLEDIQEKPPVNSAPLEPIIKTETIIKRKLPDNIIKTTAPSIIEGKVKPKLEPVNELQKIYQEDTYLTDIPNPFSNTETQALDVMLNNEQIMKPRKVKAMPKVLEKPSKEITKEKKELTKPNQELDIFDGLLTLDDYKRVLSILKTYQKKKEVNENTTENKEPIKLEDFRDLYKTK